MPPQQQNPYTGNGSSPQQNQDGQYGALPPLPAAPNNGHSGHNPYEFIVNPQSGGRGPSLFGNNPFLMRIVAILGVLVIIVIIGAVLVSAFSPKSPTASMTEIAQREQEIIRVSDMTRDQLYDQDTKNFVANVEVSVSSDQAQTLAYLTSHKTTIKDKQLALDQDSNTDSLLTSAQATNTYDTATMQIMTGLLEKYQALLKTTFDQTTSKSAKDVINKNYATAGMLLQQAKAVNATNN